MNLLRRTAVTGVMVALAALITPGVSWAMDSTAEREVRALRGYVTDEAANNVVVVDPATNTITRRIKVGMAPRGIAVTPDGKRAYVANSQDGTVSVIDTTAAKVIKTIKVGSHPQGVAVTPDGRQVYVTNQESFSASVIATTTNKITATVRLREAPTGVAVSPDGKHAYVANLTSQMISVIDTRTAKATDLVEPGDSPREVAVTPDGKLLCVTTVTGGLEIYDLPAGKRTGSVPVGEDAAGVAVGPDGSHAFVASARPAQVSTVNLGSGAVSNATEAGGAPRGIAASRDSKQVYAVGAGTVTVLDAVTGDKLISFTAGEGLYGIAFG